MAAQDDENRNELHEFASKAARQYRDSQKGMAKRHKLKLPIRVVQEFIRNAYYASLIPDEGRHPKVTIMCYQGGTSKVHFLLAQPIAPSVSNIAKLAHAVGPGNHIACMAEDGVLRIWGSQVTVLDELRHFGYSSSRVANPLKVSIVCPGHIEVSTGGSALIYKAGKVDHEESLAFSGVVRALGARIAPQFADRTRGTVEALEYIFNDIIKGIAKQEHGGMLLVGEGYDARRFSSGRRIQSDLLSDLLIRYWDDSEVLLKAAGGLTNLINDTPAGPVAEQQLTLSSTVSKLENCVAAISRLAGVDGAIVMDYGCRVHAFNAIIAKGTARSSDARLVDRFGRKLTAQQISKDRGSRFQSAMSLARRVRDSFAFVVSQDGGVSVFHNQNDGTVLYETDLQVLQ